MKTINTIRVLVNGTEVASYIAKNAYEAKRVVRLVESLDYANVNLVHVTTEVEPDGTAQEICKMVIDAILNNDNHDDENPNDRCNLV